MRNFSSGKFPTRTLNTKVFGDLILAETFYTAGQVIENHSHNTHGFIIVLKGEFVEIQSRRNHVCKSADVIFRPAGHLHGDAFRAPATRCLNLQFTSHWLSRFHHAEDTNTPSYFSGGELFQLGLKIYKEYRIADQDSPLILEGLSLEMVGSASRFRNAKTETGLPQWMKKIQDRLHDSFGEPLTVLDLAAEAGIHPVYLNRAFRKRFGQTIGQYMRKSRMDYCCTKLASTSTPLAEISAGAGFCDQAHFSRFFKRMHGMTPLAYRRIFRKV